MAPGTLVSGRLSCCPRPLLLSIFLPRRLRGRAQWEEFGLSLPPEVVGLQLVRFVKESLRRLSWQALRVLQHDFRYAGIRGQDLSFIGAPELGDQIIWCRRAAANSDCRSSILEARTQGIGC
jgi:hypothetical protein